MRIAAPLALASALLVAAPAAATTVLAGSIEELAASADDLVIGEVTSVEPFIAADGRVFTRVTVAPSQARLAHDGEVELIVPGGRTDTLATRVFGAESYRTGEQVAVFVEARPDGAFQSVSLAFSKFELVPQGDDGAWWAVRDLDELSLVEMDPITGVVTTLAVEYPTALSLDELVLRADEAFQSAPR